MSAAVTEQSASLKRPTTTDEEAQRPAKGQRRRKVQHRLRQRAPASASATFDDGNIQSLLTRSLHHTLNSVGFDGADPTAVESLRACVEEYLLRMTSSVARSMHSSRRSNPLPQDFTHALTKQSLTFSSLSPYVRMKPPRSVALPELEILPPEEPPQPRFDVLLTTLQGANHKTSRPFVPTHLPPFPGKHTYKATPDFTERAEDPRKIRERATEEGRLGEEALRRLVAAGGGVGRTGVVRGGDVEGWRRRERDVWKDTVDVLTKVHTPFPLTDGMTDEQAFQDVQVDGRSSERYALQHTTQMAVNAEKSYWRRSLLSAKTGSKSDAQKAGLVGERGQSVSTQ